MRLILSSRARECLLSLIRKLLALDCEITFVWVVGDFFVSINIYGDCFRLLGDKNYLKWREVVKISLEIVAKNGVFIFNNFSTAEIIIFNKFYVIIVNHETFHNK